jgi:serine phosphatase RsbU (regulator of sigma subunit)
VPGGSSSEPARRARFAAAGDRARASLDRQAGTRERDLAERDRDTALGDREAGARERADAERDRAVAVADRGAGASERDFAGRDRGTALADRRLTATDRRADEHDRISAERDFRFRAGLAEENSRLYKRQRSFSEQLQRSLLTEPPQSEHFQIAVRYVAAEREEEVGGDWYDAFVLGSGETMIAIGDVMGHDVHAAVAMAHMRGLLRGIGYTTGDQPAALLTRLDAAIHGLAVGMLATAIVARLEYHHGDVEYGRARLLWSNAGHPPAMVVEPNGEVRILAGEEDLILGVDVSAERRESVSALAPGSTVLLYTDGLVERRDLHLDDGIARLVAVLGSIGGKPLADICDAVLTEMLAEANADDVALLAVRVLDGTSVV